MRYKTISYEEMLAGEEGVVWLTPMQCSIIHDAHYRKPYKAIRTGSLDKFRRLFKEGKWDCNAAHYIAFCNGEMVNGRKRMMAMRQLEDDALIPFYSMPWDEDKLHLIDSHSQRTFRDSVRLIYRLDPSERLLNASRFTCAAYYGFTVRRGGVSPDPEMKMRFIPRDKNKLEKLSKALSSFKKVRGAIQSMADGVVLAAFASGNEDAINRATRFYECLASDDADELQKTVEPSTELYALASYMEYMNGGDAYLPSKGDKVHGLGGKEAEAFIPTFLDDFVRRTRTDKDEIE